MSMTLKQMITTASKTIEQLFRKDDFIAPIYHLLKSDGTHMVWGGLGEDKDEMTAIARRIMRELEIVSYVFIDEAWILETKPRTPAEDAEVIRFCQEFGVSAHPDRREVVMFYAESKDGERLMAQRYILRPEHGKPTLSPLQFAPEKFSGGRVTGRMTGLLQP